MKRFNILLPFLLVSVSVNAQTWTWDSKTTLSCAGGTLYKDNCGNIFSVESYSGTVTKLDIWGVASWQLSFPSNQDVRNLTVSPDSTFYISGIYTDTLAVGTTTYICGGQGDPWIAKYDYSGNLIWFKTVEGKGADVVSGLTAQGNDLVVCGWLEDTANFIGQQIPVPGEQLFFVARLNGFGQTQNIKLSAPPQDSSFCYFFFPGECATDPSGNIYLLLEVGGATKIDTFQLGPSFGGNCVLIKLDAQLSVQWVSHMPSCYMYCSRYSTLRVAPSGNSYFLSHWSYGQSGADDDYSYIHFINSSGSYVKNFGFGSQGKNWINGLDLDSCGNVYFSGMRTSHAYMQPWWTCLTTGQLSPGLNLNWMKEECADSSYRGANNILALSVNDCLVNGSFSNLVLADTLIDTTYAWQDNYFLARLQTIVSAPQNVTATGNDLVCTGQTAVLSGQAAAPINWYQTLAGGNSIYTGSSFTVPLLGAGVYTYYAEASTCSMTTARLPITVTIIPSPTIQVSDGKVCKHSTYTISPSGAQQYYFSSGSSVVSPTSTTTYTIYGAGANGCADSAMCSVTPIPSSQPTIVTSIHFMCPGQTAVLSCLGSASYTWQTGLTNQPLAVSPSVHTTYSVVALDSNGCGGTDMITQYVAECLGLAESGQDGQKIFPNPTEGPLIVSSQNATIADLINASGQRVLLLKLNPGENAIDLSAVEHGLYLLCIEGQCHRIVRR
jgi:hypothetical protein